MKINHNSLKIHVLLCRDDRIAYKVRIFYSRANPELAAHPGEQTACAMLIVAVCSFY